MGANIFDRFKTIGFRITLAAGVLILLSVATGYVGVTTSDSYRQDAETVTSLAKRTTDVFETDVLIYKMVRAEKDFVLTAQEKFKNERINFSNSVDDKLDNLIQTSLTQESKQLLDDLKDRKVDYDKNFETAVGIYAPFTSVGGFGGGGTETVLEINEQEAFNQVKELSLSNTDILLIAETDLISKIVNLDVAVIEDTLAGARETSQQVRFISLGAIAASLFVGTILAFFVIRAVTRSLRSIVERLIRLADVLRDSVSQATEVANRNASTATQLASSASQQSKQVEEITSTISQTAAGIAGVANLAKEGSDSAGSVTKLAQEGGEGAERGASGLDRISKVVSEAVERIGRLAGNSREVGGLAGEVTNIADQTNILALNAAIEAARAGEAGRCFAVVADEVRRLAEGSRTFADQITKLINSVVEEAQQSASSTSEGAKEIEESTGIINTALSAFKQISDSVGEANAKIQEIATNITQQAQSAEQISKTASSISQGIEQNSTSARTLADAVDQQKVVISVIEKSLEEAQALLAESRVLVGLNSELDIITETEDNTDAAPAEAVKTPLPAPAKKLDINKPTVFHATFPVDKQEK
jgi:methyl-accepting chemotaxis protein